MSNRHVPLWRIAIALVALIFVAACGGDDDSAGSNGGSDSNGADEATTETLNVASTEFAFNPDSLSVAAGSTEIVLDNTDGAVEHDFTVDELDIAVHATPGATESETYDIEAGTYEFYCSIPGHREAGMEGTLTVS